MKRAREQEILKKNKKVIIKTQQLITLIETTDSKSENMPANFDLQAIEMFFKEGASPDVCDSKGTPYLFKISNWLRFDDVEEVLKSLPNLLGLIELFIKYGASLNFDWVEDNHRVNNFVSYVAEYLPLECLHILDYIPEDKLNTYLSISNNKGCIPLEVVLDEMLEFEETVFVNPLNPLYKLIPGGVSLPETTISRIVKQFNKLSPHVEEPMNYPKELILYIQALRGDLDQVIKLYHIAGYDMDKACGEEQNTLLHFAAANNDINLAMALLQRGAKTSIMNKRYETPKDWLKSHKELYLMMLQRISISHLRDSMFAQVRTGQGTDTIICNNVISDNAVELFKP